MVVLDCVNVTVVPSGLLAPCAAAAASEAVLSTSGVKLPKGGLSPSRGLPGRALSRGTAGGALLSEPRRSVLVGGATWCSGILDSPPSVLVRETDETRLLEEMFPLIAGLGDAASDVEERDGCIIVEEEKGACVKKTGEAERKPSRSDQRFRLFLLLPPGMTGSAAAPTTVALAELVALLRVSVGATELLLRTGCDSPERASSAVAGEGSTASISCRDMPKLDGPASHASEEAASAGMAACWTLVKVGLLG